MKMNQKLLLTASVFFVLLVLVGCGIATIFYNDVSYSEISPVPETEVQGSFIFTNDDSLKMITPGTGPSLLLGYTVTDSSNTPHEVNYEKEFDTRYRKNGYFGQAISSSEILSITNNDKQYRLYQLSDSTHEVFRSPGYVATAQNNLTPNCTYKVELQADNTLELTISTNPYILHNIGNLRRFNGYVFTKTDYSSFPDYTISDSPGSTFYIHLFGAMNVSEGVFSNIFWSPLSYLGYIALGSSE